ncbi:MAG: tryptophan-rich sensory protein [Gammaproteobacteria bacterium]|nr:tryptophan-rich sensory protein [Gammaproteobacteria bacterium]
MQLQRRFSDWGGNILAFIGVLVVNGMANGIPLGGQTTGEISAKYPALFTPSGFTFSIWGLIYLALTAFIVYQALPSQRSNERIAAVSHYFKLSCLANAAWIFVWHFDLLGFSLLLMLVILGSLMALYRGLGIVDKTAPVVERMLVQWPFSLYLGWISVATIANFSAVQIGWGFDEILFGAVLWTQIKLALAGAISATVLLHRDDVIFVLVVAWAAFGISVKQAATPDVSGAALMLSLFALLLAAAALLRKLRSNG